MNIRESFNITAQPSGEEPHNGFPLEWHGVRLSWAIPKGALARSSLQFYNYQLVDGQSGRHDNYVSSASFRSRSYLLQLETRAMPVRIVQIR
jgi:hypothetical protein